VMHMNPPLVGTGAVAGVAWPVFGYLCIVLFAFKTFQACCMNWWFIWDLVFITTEKSKKQSSRFLWAKFLLFCEVYALTGWICGYCVADGD
jgi:hypothetical protein